MIVVRVSLSPAPLPSDGDRMETVPVTPEVVNRTPEKIGPENFDLLKVLGKGGYGKVSRSSIVVELASQLSGSLCRCFKCVRDQVRMLERYLL